MNFFEELSRSPLGQCVAFALGLLWGSFFNVCILRIPERKDIVFAPSMCPNCKKRIPWFCNIPVLSWVVLRAKCLYCKKYISIQYPLVELCTAFLFLWVYLNFGWTLPFVLYAAFLGNLLVISVIDLYLQIIPDELSLGGVVVGFIASFFLPQVSWVDSLWGILLGGGSFYLVALLYEKLAGREGLGGGDVKLLAMIGAWLGYQSILPTIILSSALGSVVGVFVLVFKGGNMKTAIPFGPFLAFGAFVYVFWSKPILNLLFPSF